jgi:hypothetical protein
MSQTRAEEGEGGTLAVLNIMVVNKSLFLQLPCEWNGCLCLHRMGMIKSISTSGTPHDQCSVAAVIVVCSSEWVLPLQTTTTDS